MHRRLGKRQGPRCVVGKRSTMRCRFAATHEQRHRRGAVPSAHTEGNVVGKDSGDGAPGTPKSLLYRVNLQAQRRKERLTMARSLSFLTSLLWFSYDYLDAPLNRYQYLS